MKALLETETLSPLVAHKILTNAYGLDYLDFAPETLWALLFRDFKAQLPRHNKDCIQATRTLIVFPGAFEDWLLFEKIIKGLNGVIVNFDDIQPLTPGEILFGLYVTNALNPDMKFSPDTDKYIAASWMYYEPGFLPQIVEAHAKPYLKAEYPKFNPDSVDFRYFIYKLADERKQFAQLKNTKANHE